MAARWDLNFLIILGAWSAFVFTRRVVRFIYVYVRPSSIGRYQQREAWALVTGATEGKLMGEQEYPVQDCLGSRGSKSMLLENIF